ncbi:MAG: NAD(P)-dependent oxidoreductase, partial [Bacteroidales bacterium]|nr:NAD(P)-dependent oxidoreductase [Bacteroidales bacterium]
LWGDPECARDVFYVKDCTQIIEKAFSVQQGSGLYNVGTGRVVTRREQIQGIIDLWSPEGHPSTIVVNRDKPDSPCYLLDISTTVRDLGFVPHYDYMTYLRDLKQEMEQNRFRKLWGSEEDYTQGL